MVSIERLKLLIADEERGHRYLRGLQADAKQIPAFVAQLGSYDRERTLARGVAMVREIMAKFAEAGVTYDKADAGHGLGHVVRDYVNGLCLLTKLEVEDPRVIFPGFVAGVLHDCACGVVGRYDERESVVRHAGAAIFLIDAAVVEVPGFNTVEVDLIEYGVAAHTHYLKPIEAKGEDGATRILDPWPDTDQDGKPYLSVWLPRWIDRLDCNGPCFIARHYLTLATAHDDFAQGGFYPVEFAPHMRPLLRTSEEIKADGGRRTMLEHVSAFRDSQTNASPYGKHDFGIMVAKRDWLSALTGTVFDAVKFKPLMCAKRQEKVLKAWNDFLAFNIEPHPAVGRPTADRLSVLFDELPHETQGKWANAFEAVLVAYKLWAAVTVSELDRMPAEWMPFLDIPDVRDIIRPHPSWAGSVA